MSKQVALHVSEHWPPGDGQLVEVVFASEGQSVLSQQVVELMQLLPQAF